MISERKRIAARLRSEGEGQSPDILGTMEIKLRQIRSTPYRRVQEVHGTAVAETTRDYRAAFGADPEFYAFSRRLEAYKTEQNTNATLILTTDSDYYRYLKRAEATTRSRAQR
jgi:membrane protease subunit HflC